ncbi:hypothetical protein [Photobacterium indicum]|uniref:hypothetical protein n=1 Tax=Photobacterium indicum TaxID=81447 RepID=UPI003D0BC535
MQEAIRCPIDGVNPVLLQRHTVFITDESLNVHLPAGVTGGLTPAVDVALLSGSTLKKARQRPLIGIAIAAGALAVGAGLFYGLTPESPPPPPIPVDPYAAYRLTVSTAITATPALNNTVALAAYSELLPQGWTVNTLTLEGAAVVLRVNRTQKGSDTGKHTTLIAWLAQHPALQDFATATFDTLTVSIPLTGTLSSWANTAVPIEPMTTHALDSFLALGWTFTHSNGLGAVTQENTVTLTKAASLADIQQLANILAPLPAAMTDLSVTPSSVGVFTTTLTLTLLGTTP